MAAAFQDVLGYKQICSEKTLQSNSKGFFLDFCEFVTKEAGTSWIKNVFGKIKSDLERIKCVYTADATGELVNNFLNNVQEVYRPKNREFSQKKRAEADALMLNSEYQKALILYSQSVMRAPRNTEDFNLALWGRSQALIKLKKYSSALEDIQQALKENLANSYKGQAFYNMAECYSALGEENRAKVSMDLAEKFQCKTNINLSKGREKIRNVANKFEVEKPQVLGKPSEKLPNASNKLSMKTSNKLGRYVVANKDISPGETLLVEAPYAACLLPEKFGTHCHNCLKKLEAPYGCPDCASVAFCSVKCRNIAVSTYHQYECKYLDLLIGSGMSILGHTALRMVTQFGLEKSKEIYKNKLQEKVYKLCNNSHLRNPEDFLQRTLMAAFLLRCLQKSNFFNDSSTRVVPNESEYQIGELLLLNLQLLQFNAHEVFEKTSSSCFSKTVYVGVAVYLTASLFNHDCHLALSRHFVGKDIVLTSVRPLKENDMVPENYGPNFTRKNISQRQLLLSSRYWFDCKCLACQQDWPTLDGGLENVNKRLKCTTVGCSQTFTLPLKKQIIDCAKCKKTIDLTINVKLLNWCEEQYQLALSLAEKTKIKEAIDVLVKAINTFYTISLCPNKETQLAEEMLSLCYMSSENIRE